MIDRQQLVISLLRDLMNFLLFFTATTVMIISLYKTGPELEGLKNVLLPMKSAIFLGVALSIFLTAINRVTTILAMKILIKRQQKQRRNHYE